MFSNSSQKLGEIHWFLQKALIERKNRSFIPGIKIVLTPFGKEVGIDEISWWVFKKEKDNAELERRTKEALAAVQRLKDDSLALKDEYDPISYEQLIIDLNEFNDAHQSEITVLHDYVVWLSDKDLLAPVILFTYRVWGSTPQSDRAVEIKSTTITDAGEGFGTELTGSDSHSKNVMKKCNRE
jgi:hypothetical protein